MKSRKKRKLAANRSENPRQRMIQCASLVNRNAVRRESVEGVEHIVVSSYTLPDDIVMNGGLYPADEIEAGYSTLERTLAPVEHPVDSHGNFLQASDPIAIHNFHAGAWNTNVTREGGRVHIEKWINVQEALKTDRGRRLLDRINELETSEDPRPVHTSVGVFITVEDLKEPKTNAAGLQYNWIARDMIFDHDAILLDSVGAAQPSQGVGMAVNSDGESVKVERVVLNVSEANADIGGGKGKDFTVSRLRSAIAMLSSGHGPADAERASIHGMIDAYLERLKSNAEGMSIDELQSLITQALNGILTAEWLYVARIYPDDSTCIFETNTGYYEVPYRLDDKTVTIVGIPVRVDRVETFIPKVNQSSEGDAMKELILNALKKAGIETDGKSDDELFAAYNQLQAETAGDSTGAGSDTAALAAVVDKALGPLVTELNGLKAQINAQSTEDHAKLADLIANSGKYPGLDVESAKLLPVEKLREMAANCGIAVGIPLSVNSSTPAAGYTPTELAD